MIDLHTHLLPSIDDGSRSAEQSITVLEKFAEAGVTDVVLTPHVRAGELTIDPEDALERRAVAYELLQREYLDNQYLRGLHLHLGFEIMLDQPLPAEIMSDRRFSLAGSRYYLIEFSMSIASDLVPTALESFNGSGALPLVAHPERYGMCGAKAICSWRELGARMLVDATTITKSTSRGGKARQLLAAGCADAIASDNHGDNRSITTALDYLGAHGYSDIAGLLAQGNTKAILEDEDLKPVQPAVIREGVWRRFKSILKT